MTIMIKRKRKYSIDLKYRDLDTLKLIAKPMYKGVWSVEPADDGWLDPTGPIYVAEKTPALAVAKARAYLKKEHRSSGPYVLFTKLEKRG